MGDKTRAVRIYRRLQRRLMAAQLLSHFDNVSFLHDRFLAQAFLAPAPCMKAEPAVAPSRCASLCGSTAGHRCRWKAQACWAGMSRLPQHIKQQSECAPGLTCPMGNSPE